MFANTAYSQYKENSIMTARPEDLTMMLYSGLVKFIMQGMNHVESSRIEEANNSIKRAQDILIELKSSLDMKYELSEGLDSIYEYMLNRLIEANIYKDTAILDEILSYARSFRDTWAEAMKLARKDPERVMSTG